MKRLLFITLSTVAATLASAQNILPNLEVIGQRPLKETGIQKTEIDSLALKENSALSLADILTYNSSLYIKNYGRATLSTVSFRGTSPSHTQVTWNGMRINNPMLGMTDFSTIPGFFVDKASLLHGTSSITETGGALGGVVSLSTLPESTDSATRQLQYVQGVGSFRTFDEYLRFNYSNSQWATSTRLSLSSSPNDYEYINHDKKVNIYDENHNIIGQYYPKERNRSGAFRDFHILQQVYYTGKHNDKFGLNLWYINSNRELPVLTTDYGDEREFDNRQREQTLRAVASWNRYLRTLSLSASAGYSHSYVKYDYKREITAGNWSVLTRSRSKVNTLFAKAEVNWFGSQCWYVTGGISFHQHFVLSRDKNIILVNGSDAIVGYDKARLEASAVASVKWRPCDPLRFSAVLRQELYGDQTAFIPAFFTEALIWRPYNIDLKASVSKNHKFPTLNDLYFLPGGNPDLRSERGITYDVALSAGHSFHNPFPLLLSAEVNWFDSHINDWILWLPTTKGFFSPRNVQKVHAYGIESKLQAIAELGRGWSTTVNASYAWTPSINTGAPLSEADQSVGQQLPYVPRHSASLAARLTWHSWSLLYKWAYYSRRFTMTSNEPSPTGSLPPFFMSNIVLQKDLYFKPIDLQLKLAVNNIFNEHYLSVLSHPMPGINLEFFLTLTPKF